MTADSPRGPIVGTPASAAPPENGLRLSDPAVLALLGLVLVLELVSWRMQNGYPLADAVEFLDRAQTWVHGDPLGDDRTVRSFAFSAVFVPLFAIAKAFHLEDLRPLLSCARAMQMVFGLVLVFAAARLGARIAGRRAGIVAGLVVGANPFFLIYAVWPVSGIAASACVALGLERVIERASPRRALAGGLLLGLGFLFAYQILPLILVIGAMVFLRDRFRHFATLRGIMAGFAAALAVQVALDRVVYGEWGASIWRYLVDNVGPQTVTILIRLGQTDLAKTIYKAVGDLRGFSIEGAGEVLDTQQRMPRLWYFTQIDHFLSLPVLALVLFGLFKAVRDRSWAALLLFVVIVANLGSLSLKGEKSFRLLLPLLPILAPIAGMGFDWLVARSTGPLLAVRRFAGLAVLAGSVALALAEIEQQRPRYHGSYWDAIAWINEQLEAHPRKEGARTKVASAYRWAVFLRESGDVEPIRFPFPLDQYSKIGDGQKRAVKKMLENLDVLLVHLPVLTSQPELFREISELYCVRAAFYDQRDNAGLGPVFVLERRPRESGGLRFFEFDATDDPQDYRARHHLERPIQFMLGDGERAEGLTLLGYELDGLSGSDHQWITYHWYANTDLTSDLRVIDRVTGADRARSWHNNHFPAYGVQPTSQWKKGTVLRESYLLVASEDPFFEDRPYLPLGGAFRRGDLVPAKLWVAVIDGDERQGPAPPLWVRDPRTGGSARDTVDPKTLWSPAGWHFTPAGLVEVGGFFLPVHDWAKVVDDGKPMAD
jgi:hypothetical protein